MDERDDELEHRLQRFRPVGPPSELRARVLRAATTPSRGWQWIGWWSVAAALCGALLLQWRSAQLYDRLAAPDQQAEAAGRQQQIDLVTQAWGGSAPARVAAESALAEIDALREGGRPSSNPSGEGQSQ